VSEFGDTSLDLVNSALDAGVQHIVLLMRHSAREFEPGIHDLLNPLTGEGRELSSRFGELLPKNLLLRGYASPAERCLDTANLILDGHQAKGGQVTRVRPVEALGVFYVLDQMRMFKGMQDAGGQVAQLESWFREEIGTDIMMPADLAARLMVEFAAAKLDRPLATPQLDVLVSHDMTLFTVRDRILRQSAADFPVDFLDGLIFFAQQGQYFLQSHHGEPLQITRSPA